MSFFSDFKERADDFIHSVSRLELAVIGVLIFLFTAAFITAAVTSLSGYSEKKEGIKQGYPFKAAEDFLLPPEKPVTESYYFSREEKSQWDEEEASRWFTVPDENFVNTLSDANKNRIDEILGAAP